jgi:nitrogen-specific signal transduction histidine kinase/ActR/RegA family two-component response regulator
MDGLEIAARMVAVAVERGRLEEQLRQAAKTQALGVLAGGIAHDFNNMLSVVLGNAQLALTTLPDDAPAKARLRAIATASTGAADLCKQMLAFAGRSAAPTETLECSALVAEIAGLLHVALSKKATLVHDLHAAPLAIRADRGQLRQVLMNLITNASEAIGDNEGRILLSTGVRTLSRADPEVRAPHATLEPGEYVLVQVTDTGGGMSPATQARIFDPYFTTKSSGRGLGLAAVQGIVKGHGGAINVESVRGVGTTVSVLLPRVEMPGRDAAPVPEMKSAARGARILLVDDEANVRDVVSDMLESVGHTVVRAADGREAIDVFRREGGSFDCVVLDLSMPKLSGEEVFHELRAMRSDLRVILCSGYMEQGVLARLEGAGYAGFLAKPAEMQALLSKVAEVLASPAPKAS